MTRRKLTRLRLDKIAAVDLPCQEHATVAIIKRAPTGGPLAIAKATFEEALQAQLISERVSEVFWRAFDKQWAVREAFRESLTDELADGGDGSAATEGFIDATRTIAEKAVELAREAGAEAKDEDLESAVEQAVEKWLGEQENAVMKIETKDALRKAVADFNASTSPFAHVAIIHKAALDLDAEDLLPADGPLAKAKPDPELAVLKRRIDVSEMPADVRKHYDGLAEADQVAFLAKNATERQAVVDGLNAEDPVLYKTAGGVEIRKSDGAVAAVLAKQLDEQSAELTVLKAGRQTDSIEKRAAAYSNVAKGTAVAMLKSADQVGVDTEAGKDIIKSLEAMNKGSDRLFRSLGSTEVSGAGEPGNVMKARTDFNAECAKIAARDKCGPADAMSKARDEFPDLFAEAYPDTAEMDAE